MGMKLPKGVKLPDGKGLTVRRVAGKMNRTETAYAELLAAKQQAGEILAWWYEAVTFKLADDTRYTPDFMVQLTDGTIEFHETKGQFIRDDAMVKLKVFAEMFPFRVFRCVKTGCNVWDVRRMSCEE